MTKQQVIDILEAYKPSGNIYNGYNSIEEKIDERICYLIDEIIERVKLETDDDWIKCSERLSEKINQLQTYKLFQNDKETYLSKQDIIDLVSEIEREENANEEKEVIENKLKEIENNEQIHRNS